MALTQIDAPYDELAALCRRFHVRGMDLVGSVLRDDFGSESDIDILVEFDKSHTPGLAFFALQDELSQLFGRRVDLNTPGFLSPRFRDDVVSTARSIYVAA